MPAEFYNHQKNMFGGVSPTPAHAPRTGVPTHFFCCPIPRFSHIGVKAQALTEQLFVLEVIGSTWKFLPAGGRLSQRLEVSPTWLENRFQVIGSMFMVAGNSLPGYWKSISDGWELRAKICLFWPCVCMPFQPAFGLGLSPCVLGLFAL